MVICAVFGCYSNNDKRLKRNMIESSRETTKFFRFPKDERFCKIWVNKTARLDKYNIKTSFICSKHFLKEHYVRNLKHEMLNYSPKSCKKLKDDAVPTENLPSSKAVNETSVQRNERKKKRASKKDVQNILQETAKENFIEIVTEGPEIAPDLSFISANDKATSTSGLNENLIADRATQTNNDIDKIIKENKQRFQITCDYSGEVFENVRQLFNTRINNSFDSDTSNIKNKNFRMNCFNCQLHLDSMIFNDGCLNIHKIMPGLETSCKICKKNFLTNRVFHHICYLCNISIGTCKELVRHEKIIHKSIKPFTCIICGCHFKLNSVLITHIRRRHTGEKPYSCNICDEKFSSAGYLYSHKYTHSKEKQIGCNICKNKLSTPSALKKHKLTHSDRGQFECNFCKKKYSSSAGLRQHQCANPEKRQFECSFCKSKFSTAFALKFHHQIHEKMGSKPYKCDFCEKKFTVPRYLRRHLKYHEESKPYKCDLCDKKFCQSNYLKEHRYTHFGKQFQCRVCKKKFSRSYTLKRHQKSHEQQNHLFSRKDRKKKS